MSNMFNLFPGVDFDLNVCLDIGVNVILTLVHFSVWVHSAALALAIAFALARILILALAGFDCGLFHWVSDAL